MSIKSITHKVVQVEKRKLENERSSTFSTFALFAFWTLATTGALAIAAVSFYSAEPRVELASQSFGVDRITTAGVGSTQASENSTARRQNIQLANRNDRRINDVTRVINRLRGEQSTLNQRIAELDLSMGQLRSENKALKTEVASLKKIKPQGNATLIIPTQPKTDQSPKPARKLIPRTVDTKRVNNEVEVSLNRFENEDVAHKDEIPTSSFAKTTSAAPENIVDNIKVGSIPIAQTSRFALDLGASSTNARAQNLWKELSAEQPGVLTSLKPKFMATGIEEGQTRLVAGPFENAGDAIKACVQLRTIDAFCKTTLFPQ